MADITVTGMVISSMPIGEYDRRLEILTSEAGRISVFARGARKPSSSLVSVSRTFAFGTFRLFQGRNSYGLNSASISNYFTELSEDVELTAYGSYFLELARYFSRENMEAGDMLLLIYQSLRALGVPSIPHRLVRSVFELKMLQINGLCPPYDRIIAAEGQFTFAAGLSSSAAYALRFVLNTPVNKLYTFTLTDEVLEEFSSLVTHLLRLSVDKRFKSLELLETLA